jgi:hypothetical protein
LWSWKNHNFQLKNLYNWRISKWALAHFFLGVLKNVK